MNHKKDHVPYDSIHMKLHKIDEWSLRAGGGLRYREPLASRVCFRGDENVLKLTVMMITYICKYSKNH